MPDVSVVILTKNEERRIGKTLEAVFAQKTSFTYEVIVIDSGSSDKTIEFVRKFNLNLIQIPPEDFNHGKTRNLGARLAKGRYVIFLNGDAIPCDNFWLDSLVMHLERDGDVAGVYSRQFPHVDADILTIIRAKRIFTANPESRQSCIGTVADVSSFSPEEKYRFYNFDTISACLRKQVWEEIPFAKTDFAEDLEWSRKALKKGYKINYEPRSTVYHSHDFSVYQLYGKNKVNYQKLYSLFGLNTINSLYKLIAYAFFYTARDTYSLYRDVKNPGGFFCNILRIPAYAFATALGQYIGVLRAIKRKGIYENTTGCA